MANVRTERLRKRLPPPERVWQCVSAMAKSAYYYEMLCSESGIDLDEEDEPRILSRIRRLIELEEEFPGGRTSTSGSMVMESNLVTILTNFYWEVGRSKTDKTIQEEALLEALPPRFKKYAKQLTIEPEDIKTTRSGKKMGPRATALKKVGRIFNLGGERTVEKLLKKESNRIFDKMAVRKKRGWLLVAKERLALGMEREIKARLDVRSGLQKFAQALRKNRRKGVR